MALPRDKFIEKNGASKKPDKINNLDHSLLRVNGELMNKQRMSFKIRKFHVFTLVLLGN